jgi:6-phosphogluconolactonase/glucosamine-6-phosphate isomerase/deaminase
LLLLSGGSALSILDYLTTTGIDASLTLTVLDERYSYNDKINNFAQIEKYSFFTEARIGGMRIIDTKILPTESLVEVGQRFEKALHDWREQNKDGYIIAVLGVGTDGHTAGIFPNIDYIDWSADKWVESYTVSKDVNPFPERITVNFSFLRTEVSRTLVYAVGEEKKVILERLMNGTDAPSSLPIAIAKDMPAVTIVTDQNLNI